MRRARTARRPDGSQLSEAIKKERIAMSIDDKQKVPLSIAWLSENGLLVQAAAMLGYKLELIDGRIKGANETGAPATMECGPVRTTLGTRKGIQPVTLEWADSMLFTVAQLLELGFEPGTFQYCPECKRLQVDCDKERADIYDHNHST